MHVAPREPEDFSCFKACWHQDLIAHKNAVCDKSAKSRPYVTRRSAMIETNGNLDD